MHVVGVVLHPQRDSAEAVNAILGWAIRRDVQVLGVEEEIRRLNCAAVSVSARTCWSASAATEPCCAPCGWPMGSAPRCSG